MMSDAKGEEKQQGKEPETQQQPNPMAVSVCSQAASLKQQAIAAAAKVLDLQREYETAKGEMVTKAANKFHEEAELAHCQQELRVAMFNSEAADQSVAHRFQAVFDDEKNNCMSALCTSFSTLALSLTKDLPPNQMEKEFDANVAYIERITKPCETKPIVDQTEDLIHWLNDVRDVVATKQYAAKEYARFLQLREKVEKQKARAAQAQAEDIRCCRTVESLSARLALQKEESATLSKRLTETARAGLEECARKKAALEAMLREDKEESAVAISCPKCGEEKRIFIMGIQVRSDDEALKRAYTCTVCTFQWTLLK